MAAELSGPVGRRADIARSRPSPHRGPRPALLVLAAAVSVQFGGALATRLIARVGPAGAVTLRLGLAALMLAAVAAPRARTELAGLRRSDWATAVVFGLVLAAMNLAFYESLERIPLGVAVTIDFAGPLAVTIGGSRKRSDVLWALFAGLGVFLLAGGGVVGGRHLNRVGVLCALLAAACWAAYILLSARVGRRFGGTSGLALAMVVAAAVVIPAGVVEAGSRLVGPSALGVGAVVALLSSVLPYSFELIALRRVSPRAFGILLSTDPGIAALAGLAVLGQHLDLTEIVALALVVAANVGSSWFDSRALPSP